MPVHAENLAEHVGHHLPLLFLLVLIRLGDIEFAAHILAVLHVGQEMVGGHLIRHRPLRHLRKGRLQSGDQRQLLGALLGITHRAAPQG